MIPVYEQLEAICLPRMTGYQTDLTKHDKASIEENPGVPFLHWCRDMSTHIEFLIDADGYPKAGVRVPYLFGTADRWHILSQVQSMAEYFTRPSNEPSRYAVHHYDGVKLREITVDKAVEIVRDYRRRIETEFRKTPEPVRRYAFA